MKSMLILWVVKTLVRFATKDPKISNSDFFYDILCQLGTSEIDDVQVALARDFSLNRALEGHYDNWVPRLAQSEVIEVDPSGARAPSHNP